MSAALNSRRLAMVAAAILAGSLIAMQPALSLVPAPSPGLSPADAGSAAPPPAPSRPVRARSRAEAPPVEGASCSATRRKLWVEDEGWVVRRVNRC